MNKPGWYDLNQYDISCESAIEIFSANITTSSLDSTTEVVGYIHIVDVDDEGRSDIYGNIYEFKEDDYYGPDCIYSDGELSLEDPVVDVFAMKKPAMSVNLRNLKTGSTIASGILPLSRTTDNSKFEDGEFEKVQELEFLGDKEGESLRVRYLSLTYGVYACFEIFLRSDGLGIKEEHEYEIYGEIVASYHTLDESDGLICVPLIKSTQYESQPAKVGDEIKLCRYKVAIPACSSLKVSIKLKDANEITEPLIDDVEHFYPYPSGYARKKIHGKDNLYAELNIHWFVPSQLHKLGNGKGRISCCIQTNILPILNEREVLEVFSIFIGCRKSAKLNVYGFVSTRDGYGCCRLFKQDKDFPTTLLSGSTSLPLTSPHRVITPGDRYSIFIDIKDVERRVHIKGDVHSHPRMYDRKEECFDKLFCSVIKGEHEQSFAAIYYTLFSDAVQAKISVNVATERGGSCGDIKVYGHAIASYDGFSYPTKYVKEHYRRVLFKTARESSHVVVVVDKELELIRSVVAVPISSCLLLELKLEVESPKGTQFIEEIVGFSVGETHKVINGMDLDVFICIEWSSP